MPVEEDHDVVVVDVEKIENSNEETEQQEEASDGMEKKQLSSKILRRNDSLEMKSQRFSATHAAKVRAILVFDTSTSFQSIGIVYGDIGTSPLYVYSSTFTDGIKNNDDILGVLSLILYTITLIPLIKYVLVVLKANDNGDGIYTYTLIFALKQILLR
ncbi:hypothetical protein Ahy_A06g027022 isoform A [Arachis hypogaea]|uniref:K+ potassium transporter integral membrane domain-containing protein n=1 Tax=Arachis hypogaea TaxID=3818 RepID=A0A445CMD8_ARAHY|nr:hypothetical protein Ahy_A06g027022 isoform A [Arachis hypogaea]